MRLPNRDAMIAALQAAGEAHHDYETHALQGERDEQWAGWYAAYVLGRLGNFATPTEVAEWLMQSPDSDIWAETAADYVLIQLSS